MSFIPGSLMFNRDELLTRSVSSPPGLRQTGMHRSLFPVDPDGKGTWIGINDAGLGLCLLNGYASEDRITATNRASRGGVIPALLASDTLIDAGAALRGMDLGRLNPFVVFAFQGKESRTFRWDGTARTVTMNARGPCFLTSSRLGDDLVQAPRRALFARMMKSRGSLAAQPAFHNHSLPSSPETSILMSRGDARTVSRTQILIRRTGASMHHALLLRGGGEQVTTAEIEFRMQ